MDISVVIPLLNEKESLPELHSWLTTVLQREAYTYEIIYVDDGSIDGSWEVIQALRAKDPHTLGIKFQRNFGKSQALHAGFKKASGKVVITMDADLQDSPEEIPELFAMITKERYDLVSGWKKKRYDSMIAKNLPSKLFNTAARRTSGVYLHDFNCGLKAYRREVIKSIDVYGEMHRYIPVLAKNAGFTNIGEKIVQHQARKYGTTKFGIERFTHGFLDLITLWFLSRFGKQPMHFFGLLGTFMFIAGFFLSVYLGINKLFIDQGSRLITDRPEFFIALTTMILGTQFFLVGFIGELILRNNSHKKRYLIEDEM